MNSGTMSVVWVKGENLGPQMLKSCFSFHKNTDYEFLKPNFDKNEKLLISHDFTVNFT